MSCFHLAILLFYFNVLFTGLPHTQGTQGIQGNSGNFDLFIKLRETQGSFDFY